MRHAGVRTVIDSAYLVLPALAQRAVLAIGIVAWRLLLYHRLSPCLKVFFAVDWQDA